MQILLKNRLFMTMLIADMLSNFGDILFYLALMNYVLLLPDATVAISIITLSETIPSLLEVLIGFLADKTVRKLDAIFATLIARMIIYSIVGVLMGFTAALWIVLVVATLNFFSDLSGKYESALFIPLSLKIISNDERELSMAFRQTVRQVLSIVFQSISALLVTWLSYRTLAWVNAGTFAISLLIMFVMRSALSNLSQHDPQPQVALDKHPQKSFIKELLSQLKQVGFALRDYPELLNALVVLPFMNGVFSILSPLMLLFMSVDRSFIWGNHPTTIATFSILMTVCGIVGSMLTMSFFKNVSIPTLLKINTLLCIMLYIGFWQRQMIVVFVCAGLAVISSSILSPKFSSTLLNSLPQETLATTVGALNTILQLGILLMSVLVSALAVVVSVNTIAWLFIVLSIGVAFFVWARLP